MVIGTKFMTVRMEDVSAVCRNDQNSIYVVFKSGSVQNLVYKQGDPEYEIDFNKLDAGLRSIQPPLELHDK